MSISDVKAWYEESYRHGGFGAQRLYPNEELLRFMGRHFFSVPPAERASLRILEAGCGSCSNLWMVAREGFDAHGLDLSEEALHLGEAMLSRWGTSATLRAGSMTALPYEDGAFHAVLDVFSSYCLLDEDFLRFATEARRVLRPGGRLFLYTPSTASDAFRDHAPARLLDAHTLSAIERPGSPYFGNRYPFRFSDPELLPRHLAERGFSVESLELVTRTYRNRAESFQFISLDAIAL